MSGCMPIRLFGILAVIEFAWSAGRHAARKNRLPELDIGAYPKADVDRRVLMRCVLNGRIWNSRDHRQLHTDWPECSRARRAIAERRLRSGTLLAGALIDGASTSAFFTNPGSSLVLAFAALLIVVSYTIITITLHRYVGRELPRGIGRLHLSRLRRQPVERLPTRNDTSALLCRSASRSSCCTA